jgi:hypothetical protein
MVMTSPYRGPSIRADFEDVLKTVGRGAAPLFGDDAVAPEEEVANPAVHASFDFLQALDTVSDRRSRQAGLASGGPARGYVEADIESGFDADLNAHIDAEAEPSPQEAPAGAEPSPAPQPAARKEAEPAGEDAPVFNEASFNTACDPVSLSTELGLRTGLTRAQLQRLRRVFALDNHPDRLAPSRREAASRRMTIANSLIDEALRRAKAAR